MLKLIVYQFQYSKRQWFGTIPLLLVSSLIVGTSLFGIASALKTANINASQLFQMLIVFGGTTLFFLISNNIRLLIDIFKKDYQLWTILGASKSQLSILIAGQFYLMALIVSIFGTILSFATTDSYYKFLQQLLGRDELPDLIIIANIPTVLLSIFIVPTIVGLGAYFYSIRILKKESISKQNYRTRKIKVARFVSFTIRLLLWLLCVGSVVSAGFIQNREMMVTLSSIILFLLIIHIFIIQSLSPSLQIGLIKLLMKIFPTEHYVINTGFWQLLYNPSYLKSIQASMAMGITIISGFMLYTQNMYVFMNTANSVHEARASFIAYLSAPIILIITNSISLTILSSNKDSEDIKQLQTLGVSRLQLFKIRIAEAIIHSVLILLVSVVFNAIILILVYFIGQLLGHSVINMVGFWQPSLIVLGLLVVFYSITKGMYVFKDR
ncbi:TPA: FtsX-like permease family protein [Streptococcus equi subsp. zooepidemicus]|uniref:FtsX-like permease family protein n=1 Tax=Streptococcus equi TaxID=1336 RepID=UPI0005B6F4CC|nr:FtsX-like permease family protein [Streptococcus equi]VED86429.1 ABC transporter [Streptococcus equi subsp. equi]KIQ76539.1 beta-carotene 15,15'-monooxygenase [Streptococcus equi subsp. zooepidemicus]MCD3423973.1 FtsX-like permease family protein [Streptococcus equi subsp. zooepidemicus]MCD3428592.1 FtsX-like permease family protein [Streptococcus equi subsp. zooepidemicus]MCD3443305.1 FtsX-like permease family protein [Streptococcus equi subsp. zooepidemicus]